MFDESCDICGKTSCTCYDGSGTDWKHEYLNICTELEQVKKERELEKSGLMSAHQMMTSELNDEIDALNNKNYNMEQEQVVDQEEINQLRTQRDKAVELLDSNKFRYDIDEHSDMFAVCGYCDKKMDTKIDCENPDCAYVQFLAEVKEPTQKPVYYERYYNDGCHGDGSLIKVTNDLFKKASKDGWSESEMSLDCKDGRVILKCEKKVNR